MEAIILPVIVVAVIGILSGVILSVAAKYMSVPVDERVTNVRGVLPGANCGACGFAGCDEYAEKLVEGGVRSNLCPVGGNEVAKQIAEQLGTTAEEVVAKTAIVKCAGTCDKTNYSVDYQGPPTCEACAAFYKGRGDCSYSCLGFGDCERACNFDAIYIENGIAKVDKDRCTGCGMCAEACPKSIIDITPSVNEVYVACSSNEKGGVTRKLCSAGCIGCKKCEKTCEYDAIHVIDNLARIDPEKCVSCQACVGVCPTQVIKVARIGAVSQTA